MSARAKTLQILTGGHTKTAGFPPQPPPSGPSKRSIPTDHSFDPKMLKPMSKALFACSTALGHALTAYRQINRLKSATVSPDGMLGGRGYVMSVRNMRQKLFEACEGLSAIADTLHDEIGAPHWQPKLAMLDENDKEDVERFVEESEDMLDNPEGEAYQKIEQIEEANDKKKSKKNKKQDDEEEEPPGSKTPEGGEAEEDVARPKMASMLDLHAEVPISMIALPERVARRWASSSIPEGDVPRVEHRGPATGPGPWGSWNEDEGPPADDWEADEGGAGRRSDFGEDYDYTSEWENDFQSTASVKKSDAELWAESVIPDESLDDTDTEAWDFGIGYGARGQGAGNYANPSNEDGRHGVWGPQSGLPGTPPQSSGDTTTPVVEEALNDRKAAFTSVEEAEAWLAEKAAEHGSMLKFQLSDEYRENYPQIVAVYRGSELPEAGPPARSDYYRGPKDNLVQAETDAWAESEMPNDDESAPIDFVYEGVPDTAYVQEDHATSYVRWDSTMQNSPENQQGRVDDHEPFAQDGEATR